MLTALIIAWKRAGTDTDYMGISFTSNRWATDRLETTTVITQWIRVTH